MFDKGLRSRLRVAPVAFGNARTTGPDLANLIVTQHRHLLRIDDLHAMPGLAAPATHLHRVIARLGAVACQGTGIQGQRSNTLATATAADKQGCLSQAIAGKEALGAEATVSELLGKGLEAVLTDRLGTGIGYPPAAQVELGQRCTADPLAAQPIGKIGAATDGAAMIADRLQPTLWPGEKVGRGHQHARHAAEDRLQQTADQAHVVIQRQPADDDIVRVEIDAEAMADQHLIGHQIAVADLHTLGQRRGPGGVLQEGDVIGLQRGCLPGIGLCRVQMIDRQQLRRSFLGQHLQGLQAAVQGTGGQQQARFGVVDDR
ncbi:hypothetical protein D3C79_721420 [compost metagenome]